MEVLNHISGVSTELKTGVEKLIRDSERLSIIKAYVENTNYPDRDTLITLISNKKEIEKEN